MLLYDRMHIIRTYVYYVRCLLARSSFSLLLAVSAANMQIKLLGAVMNGDAPL
jgi:hypothetical protein